MQQFDPRNPAHVAQLIVSTASKYGVNPHLALGIADREGLNKNTLGSDTYGNPDWKGYSFGPFQLYSGSRDPSHIAPGGEAAAFMEKYGAAPSAANVPQQIEYAIKKMAALGPQNLGGTWHAVGDNGGVGAITKIGANAMGRYGIGPGGASGEFEFAPVNASSPSSVGGSSTTPSEAAQQQSQAYAALMGALANPPQTQRRPGILGRLLFGQQGFEGMLDKALPKNGILGAMFEGLGGAFAPSQANAAPAMAPQPQPDTGAPMFPDGNIPMPEPRPVQFGGQGVPLPPPKPIEYGGKGSLTQPDNDASGGGAINIAGLDPLRDLFGMVG